MGENVTQVLHDKAPSLLEKLVTNPDLCNVILGFVGRCIVMADQRGLPLEGISFGELQMETLPIGDLVVRSKVTFNRAAVSMPAMWPPQSEFAQYARAKAQGLGMALQRNPHMGGLFQRLIEALDSYSAHKGIPFSMLVIKQAIISSPGDMMVLKIGRALLDA